MVSQLFIQKKKNPFPPQIILGNHLYFQKRQKLHYLKIKKYIKKKVKIKPFPRQNKKFRNVKKYINIITFDELSKPTFVVLSKPRDCLVYLLKQNYQTASKKLKIYVH